MNPQKQRELNDNLDFMRGQFDVLNAQIKLPHSLDVDMMRYKLEHIELQGEKKPKKNPWLRPIIGAAACFVVVFGSIFALRGMNGLDSPLPAPAAAAPEAATDMAAAAPQMAAFAAPVGGANETQALYADSYTVLRDEVYRMNGGADYYSEVLLDGAASGAAAAGADMELGAGAPANDMANAPQASAKMVPRSASAVSFSATNTQEIGVDEADIVKTDGRYLYSYVEQNTTSTSPAIFITDSQTMQLSAKIVLEQTSISEFYVAENRLVTVGSSYDDSLYRKLQTNQTIVEATDDSILRATASAASDAAGDRAKVMPGSRESAAVQATIYDISDRAAPKQVKSFAQDGDYTTSRVANDVLYLVSSRYISPALNRKETPLSELAPIVYDGAAARVLPAGSIAIAPQGSNPCYAVVSTLDIKSGVSDTQAVLGGSDGVYMSADSLYVYYGSYRDHATGDESLYRSGIVRFDAGKKLTLGRSGVVDGYIDGQFSLSEKDGNLRVATTADGISGVSSSRVTVLNRDMQEIGLLKNIAPDERIYAARYVGDMAYLVTFRQTDPLFAIDLSDPKNPKLLGQLKIPGFSEYLHPIDDKTLLGIGQAADANGVVTGLKLSLFDVSEPTQPKELNVYNLGGQGSWSEALGNHKSVMFNPARSMFAFPAQVEKAGASAEPAYFVFTYDKVKGFTLEKAITHTPTDAYSAFNTVRRGLYIGDTLYTFSDEKVVSFNLDTFAEEKTLLLK